MAQEYLEINILSLKQWDEFEWFDEERKAWRMATVGGQVHLMRLDVLCNAKLRVPCLTPKQIEFEGWKPWPGDEVTTPWDLLLYWGSYRFEKENYILIYERKNHVIRITQKEGEGLLKGIKNQQIYDGLCPTINELRYITKLLKIK